jgi:hypothetical protein
MNILEAIILSAFGSVVIYLVFKSISGFIIQQITKIIIKVVIEVLEDIIDVAIADVQVITKNSKKIEELKEKSS